MVSPAREPNSPGELQFDAYLRQQGLDATYETEVGGRNPDFLVRHPAATFAAEIYEPEIPHGASPSGFTRSPYDNYRRAFQARKSKQIRAVKSEGYCYVAALASTHTSMPIHPAFMAGAMFGELQWSWPVSPDGDGDLREGQMVFGGGAELQPAKLRGVSAVALIELFNPTRYLLDRAIVKAGEPRDEAWQHRMAVLSDEEFERHLASSVEDSAAVAARLIDGGVFDPKAEAVRIVVLHNPFAQYPLPRECFSGPYDEQWGLLSNGRSGYGPVVYGRSIEEVPGVLTPERFETPFAAMSAVPVSGGGDRSGNPV